MGIFNLFKNDSTTINMATTTTSGEKVDNASTSDGLVSGGSGSASITEETAMKIAALYQGISIISETIASMPVFLHKDTDGFQTTLAEDSRSKILSGMTNEVLTSYNLKKNLIKDMILYGNAYAKIERVGDDVNLYYYPVSQVTPKKDGTGYYFDIQSYSTDVMGEQMPSETVDYADMLVLIKNPKFNSVTGQGLLEYASEILDLSTQETTYMVNLFKNGLSAKAVLTSKTPFRKEVKEQLKKDLRTLYSGSAQVGKTLVIEGDVDVKPLSLTPVDIMLIENKKFTIGEIARFLNIPKYMLNIDRGQGTYSNITQERMQLLTNTLTPYTVAIEEALNQKLLSQDEQNQGYYFQFNTSDMLKLSPEDNAKYMINLYKENIVTLEEVRSTLNLGGDQGTIDELKQYQALKMSQIKAQYHQAKAQDGIVGNENEDIEGTKDQVPQEENKNEEVTP